MNGFSNYSNNINFVNILIVICKYLFIIITFSELKFLLFQIP